MKTGAEEYLVKPFTDEELLSAVARTLNKIHMRKTIHRLPKQKPLPRTVLLVNLRQWPHQRFHCRAAHILLRTVLIFGESGTGNELVARALHYGSQEDLRAVCPCQLWGHPGELLESELFGHIKGAFTGATEDPCGFFSNCGWGNHFP